MARLVIPQGSVEYVRATVSMSDGTSLDAQTVQLCVVLDGTAPGSFVAGSWEGTAGTSRVATTASPYTFSTAGRFQVYVKVTGSPEAPIWAAGEVLVTPTT